MYFHVLYTYINCQFTEVLLPYIISGP